MIMSRSEIINYAAPTKEDFFDIAKANIHREGIDKLLNFLDENGYFEAPASTRYHGSYKGGLFHHSLNVYYNLKDELQLIFGENWSDRYSLETVTLVSLFHDVCKYDKYIQGVRNVKNKNTGAWEQVSCFEYNQEGLQMGHAALSLHIIEKFVHLDDVEAQAIYWHMGAYDLSQYSTVGNLSESFKRNILAFALHMADMTATYIDENELFRPIGQED